MDNEKHAYCVGRLWSSLLSLEIALRYCIGLKTEKNTAIPPLHTLKEGQRLKRTSIIDCNMLRSVIQKFNSLFKNNGKNIDEERIMRIRNTLGHGKVISASGFPMTIFNLENCSNDPNQVKIEYIAEMTRDWFESNISYLSDVTLKVKTFYDNLKDEFLNSL